MLTKKHLNIFVSALLLNMVFITNVTAKIFKCTSAKGAVYYNDKPCPLGDKEKRIKNAKDVVNGYAPLVSKSFPLAGLKSVNKISDKEAKDSQQKKSSNFSKESSTSKASNKVKNKQKPIKRSQQTSTKKTSISRTNTRAEIKNNPINRANKSKKLSPIEEEKLFIDMHAGEVYEG